MSDETQAITYKKAAQILGKSTRTIRRWVLYGILKVVRVTQRTVFVCRNQVDGLYKSPLPFDEVDQKFILGKKRS